MPSDASTTTRPADDSDEPLLDVADIVPLLKWSRATLYRRVKDGTFPPPMKFGKLSRWTPSDVRSVRAAADKKRRGA